MSTFWDIFRWGLNSANEAFVQFQVESEQITVTEFLIFVAAVALSVFLLFIANKVFDKVESKFTIVVNKSGVGGDRAGNTYEYSARTAKTLGGRVLTVFSCICFSASIGVLIIASGIGNMENVLSELSSAVLIFLSVVGIPVAILVLIICALLRLKNAIVEIIKEIITGW